MTASLILSGFSTLVQAKANSMFFPGFRANRLGRCVITLTNLFAHLFSQFHRWTRRHVGILGTYYFPGAQGSSSKHLHNF